MLSHLHFLLLLIFNSKRKNRVLIVSSFVTRLLSTLLFSFLGTSNKNIVPNGWRNFVESVVEFIEDIAQNQLGETAYRPWLPFIGTSDTQLFDISNHFTPVVSSGGTSTGVIFPIG